MALTGRLAWIFRYPPTGLCPLAIRIWRRACGSTAGLVKNKQVVVISQPTVGAAAFTLCRRIEPAAAISPGPLFIGCIRSKKIGGKTTRGWPHAGIAVSDGQDGNVYSLLAQSRIQIGVYSAALVEGLAFGLETYLVDLPGVEYLQPLIDRKWAKLVCQRVRDRGRHRPAQSAGG